MPTISGHPSPQDIILSEISTALHKPPTLLDLESSFIENGGDSLSSIHLQAALRRHGIYISVLSIFEANTLLCLADCSTTRPLQACGDLVVLPNFRPGTKRRRSSANGQPSKRLRRLSSVGAAPKVRSICTRYPMTEMQLSLVHSAQNDSRRSVISYFETHRSYNVPLLKRAWKEVLTREAIFNMRFEVDEFGGHMCEDEGVPFVWEETVVESESSYRREIESSIALDTPVGYGFKVVTRQITGTERTSTIIWRVHHALVDGVSCALVRAKVQRVLAGEQTQPGPSFANFSKQLQSLQLKGREAAATFWARQTKEHNSAFTQLCLPTPSKDQPVEGGAFGQVSVNSDHEKLRAYSKQIGVTVASLYYAAWGLVLSRYSDSTQICFGAVLSGRNLPIEGVQSIVGPTINTLPLYISLDTRHTLEKYIRQVFNSLLELTSFQWTTPSHGFTRNFSSAVNVRFEGVALSGTPFGPLEHPHSRVESDFPLHIEIGRCGRISLGYDTKAFFPAHIERLAATFTTVLDSILQPCSTVESCLDKMIGRNQRMDLGRMGNWYSGSTRDGSIKDDLVSLFKQAAETNPSVAAVEHCSRTLTYAELYDKSSVVARHLSKLIVPGDVVCIHADGTVNWIIAIYGVLQAGGTYCPLDQQLPDVTRAANFAAAKAKLFLTGSVAARLVKPASCETCLSVEELLLEDSAHIIFEPRKPSPDSNAYICFTSGSTGKPKGVICRHAGLVAFQSDLQVRLQSCPGWRIAQFMSPGFDGSIHEIFSALSYGSTLVLKDCSKPFDHLKICDAAILTPSVAKVLEVAEFSNLKAMYLVGEAVPQSVCDTWAPNRQLFNMYGPTEATCGATIKSLVANEPVTLGVPNPSTRVYVLDSHQRVVPWGVIGEIYLAGVQVATGYIGQPDETAKRFLPDSIHPQYGGEYMYRTGDRAYWNERGELEFLGRGDRQIKLRGFRIDLDDLEIRMTRADNDCTSTAVAVRDNHLVALVQPAGLDLKKFRSHIRQHIPVYALPRVVLAVESFPTTPVGKLDYKAIATTALPETVEGGTALTISEQMVLSALRDVLGMPANAAIDGESSFSDLGGNSMTALFLSHRLSRSFKQRIPVRMILDSDSIQVLTGALASLQVPDEQRINVALGEHGVSPIESEWWHKYQQQGNTSSFNVTYACDLPNSIERQKLVSAWNSVLRRHRILSCRFKLSQSRGLVKTYARHSPTVKQVEAIDIQLRINSPFNLDEDDLVRVFVSPAHMLVVISHIICDLTTLKTILREVADSYDGLDLPTARKTYSETTWSMPATPGQLSFWSDYLSGAPQSCFSIGSNRTPRKSWEGSSHVLQVPSNTHRAMLQFASSRKVTMHQLALAAVALALQHDNDTCDITIGAPYLNRNSEEDQEVVGLFLEPLPIRIRYPLPGKEGAVYSRPSQSAYLEPCPEQDSFVKAVQKSSRAALSHAVPWDQLLLHLGIQADFPTQPLFDAMVTFHEAGHEIEFPVKDTRFLPTWSDGAKFKVMAEFAARADGTLTLRLEYGSDCFTPEDASFICRLIMRAIDGLLADEDYDVIARKLRSSRVVDM